MSTDNARQLGERFLDDEKVISTSVLGRVARSARSAVGLGRTLFSRGEPDLATVMRLTTQLGELKGVAMKMGQVLAFLDPTLPTEVRQLLGLLQTRAPASPWETIEATLRDMLGDKAEALLAGLDRRPVAVASIGQVHHGRLPGGTEVAVKVRHRGIDAALRADFAAARSGVTLANTVLFGAAAGARDALEEARSTLLAECDFAAEADHQERFARLFGADPVLDVPGVEREFCAEAVLTTRWRPGRSLDQLLATGLAQAERDRIGEALFRFYIGALYRSGWFHADPHPGNYAFSEDGRVIVYDFGCVRHFAAKTVVALADLVSALRAGEVPAICDAAVRLGFRTRFEGEDLDTFLRFARSFFAPLLERGRHVIAPDSSFDAGRMVRDKRLLARLGMPGHLLFLLRIRFGLYAVLARLGAAADWGELESTWAASVRRSSDP